MALALLQITLEIDDGGKLAAVLTWVEVQITDSQSVLRIDAQSFRRIERVSVN